MDLLVVGNIAFDTILKVKFLPKINEATSITDIKITPGGCAGNVAVVAKTLGINSALYSAVGRDFKDSSYEKKLRRMGIDIENLQYVDDLTARSFMFSDSKGNQQIYYYPGASARLRYKKVDFSKYRYIHFSAGEISVYERLMRDAKEKGCIVSFDPGQEIFHRDIEDIVECFRYANYLFFNEYEANYVMRKMDVKDIWEIFSKETIAIIVSMGENGSKIYTEDGYVNVRAIKVKNIRDPTGAGDSHRAGFLAGIMKGYDEVISCRIGSIVSSFIIQEIGAQENIPSWDDVLRIYQYEFGKMSE